MTARLTILADDLTGGCDTGTLFAGCSPVPLAIWPRTVATADVGVVDTESRALPASASAERVRSAAAHAPAQLVFKKVDSTLRGRIGAEVEALMGAIGAGSALFCPTFPAQGRSVVDGILRVHGTPVSATPIARDPDFPAIPAVSPRATSGVVELLSPQFQRPLVRLPLGIVRRGIEPVGARLRELTGTVVIADAETSEDLEVLVSAVLDNETGSLLVGSAGLARPVAHHLGVVAKLVAMPPARRWLIVVGSRHPTSRRQAAAATAAGLRVLVSPQPDAGERAHVATDLAERAQRVIASGEVDLVAVTGGETAVALFETLGCERVDLVGAPQPGLALGYLRAPSYPSLPALTKAGGFGADDLFVALAELATAREARA